jgi:hypothetical protein
VTNLDTDNVRRLDALNLIQAYIDEDAATAAEIASLYPDDDQQQALLASTASAASILASVLPGGRELLAQRREYLLAQDPGQDPGQ